MVGAFVMTENELLKRRPTPDRSAWGPTRIDSHNVQRYITPEGYVQNEGDIGVPHRGPYEIAYGSLVPKREAGRQPARAGVRCPARTSRSARSRMEPVFMVLGQSAATAAAIANGCRHGRAGLPCAQLTANGWCADGQVLETGARGRGSGAQAGVQRVHAPTPSGSTATGGRTPPHLRPDSVASSPHSRSGGSSAMSAGPRVRDSRGVSCSTPLPAGGRAPAAPRAAARRRGTSPCEEQDQRDHRRAASRRASAW